MNVDLSMAYPGYKFTGRKHRNCQCPWSLREQCRWLIASYLQRLLNVAVLGLQGRTIMDEIRTTTKPATLFVNFMKLTTSFVDSTTGVAHQRS